jgi:hypothetical protein
MTRAMALVPGSILDSLGHDPERWPGDLTGRDGERAKEQLESLLAVMPEDVRGAVIAALLDPDRNVWAQTAVYALRLAATAGCKPKGMLDEDRIHMCDPDDSSFALAIMGFTVPQYPAGRRDDVDRLVASLESTFGNRRYVLYLRQPVPESFDPAPIARAVHLWLGAIDRGEWHGQHAIYEDDDISLELILTDETAAEGIPARVFTVRPITALERLANVDQLLVEHAATHDETHGEMPLVFALGANGPWRMPRGYAEQLLYGTADWTSAVHADGATAYQSAFSPNGRSLFSDPACANVSGLWWVEPTGEHPLALRSWSHENPWAPVEDRAPLLGILRFEVVDREAEAARGKICSVLTWREHTESAVK